MRVAVVSDIHGNLTALEAVIADVGAMAPDLVVHGGDLVGGGSSPARVIDRVRDLGWPGVRGNTDEMLWEPHRVSEALQAPALHRLRDLLLSDIIPDTRAAIGAERLAWLQSLPARWTTLELTVTHASPDNCWHAPAATASDDDLVRVYGPVRSNVIVYGHIHCPYIRRLERLTIVNAGSVSLSYDGDPRAAYALLDDGRVEIRRVSYDVEEEVAKLFASGDPCAEATAETLRTGKYVAWPLK
jgi:putative phosphoesterase